MTIGYGEAQSLALRAGTPRRALATALLAALLAGCTTFGAAGPTASAVRHAATDKAATDKKVGQDISLVMLDQAALARVNSHERTNSFLELIGDGEAQGVTVGVGDLLDIAIWEAPPAVLFGTAGAGGAATMGATGAQNRAVIQQTVATDGTINVPFAGVLRVTGKSPAAIEREINARLAGRANDPQTIVRLTQNDARNVTVIGEVMASRRIPLGPRGERLLDVIASAGGPRQPVSQTTIRLTRGATTATMALDAVITDPRQNIRLRPDDVVTVLHQPYTFTALGAVTRNAEIPFEGKGITLAQALGRMGGLRDDRADIRGVFIFRLEQPDALDPGLASTAPRTGEGRVPVIYRLDLADASSFFVAQDFVIHDKDLVYVSTAPGSDLQRFLTTVSNLAFSVISVGNAVGN
jgi:polysaccharide export outer membrane protein